MRALSSEEIKLYVSRMVANGVPVRFQHEGCTVDISTGASQKKGINIIHQRHYWGFDKATALEIAHLTGTQARFSDQSSFVVYDDLGNEKPTISASCRYDAELHARALYGAKASVVEIEV